MIELVLSMMSLDPTKRPTALELKDFNSINTRLIQLGGLEDINSDTERIFDSKYFGSEKIVKIAGKYEHLLILTRIIELCNLTF